ncbi:uncharacterized protein F4807DRAFT_458009 [Annulohypoxylon truncatum]|uniref:uncharacterized protein n=1 Tax=Annulohypoxylon truncatum TaxID=327061 RepID=UPI002007924D|nr:uncharacterized protein F4807DRAFT_458009 [Annulohypoxylon truncatum]KAI1211803.1 hypothetical protein F4807DRAFT_458009 [Annulohypoxylon truncatum]
MQGDIFQMEQLASRAHATFEPSSVSVDSNPPNPNPEVAIYNEDDLSHLLYVNHLHHAGHKDKVIINHVYRDGYATPLESQPSGAQTPETETNETPVLSDCESDFDEGVYFSPSSDIFHRRSPLKFEDGFEFPVFLGRQAEESSPHATVQPSKQSGLDSQNKRVRIAAPEESHVLEISGPLMSWWPEPLELMEHEWIDEKVANNSSHVMSTDRHVSSIDGPLMSWWPAPVELLEHEWDERFYE